MKEITIEALMPLDLSRITERVKAAREHAGLTQRELADAAGVHLSIVFKIEQGTNPNPRIATLAAIAEALDITLDELIGRELDEPTAPPATPPAEALEAEAKRPHKAKPAKRRKGKA